MYAAAASNLKKTLDSREFAQSNRKDQKQQIKAATQEFSQFAKEIIVTRGLQESRLTDPNKNNKLGQIASKATSEQIDYLSKAANAIKKATRGPSKISQLRKEVGKIVSVMKEKGSKAVRPVTRKLSKNESKGRGG